MLKKGFSLPGGIKSYQLLVQAIAELYATRRELFRDDVVIDAVYDAFSGIWCGGRVVPKYTEPDDYIREKIEYFNSRGIPFRQIFTNYYSKYYLDDENCNRIMRLLSESGMNHVVVASDVTFDYLKKTYPNIKYLSSCTKYLGDIQSIIDEHQKDYDEVCLWISQNKDSVYDAIPEELREKTEILICQNCSPACPYVYRNSLKYSVNVLEQYGESVMMPYIQYKCPWDVADNARDLLEQPITLLHDDLDHLMRKGIHHFKITGRGGSLPMHEMLLVLGYYLIKPANWQLFTDIFGEILPEVTEKAHAAFKTIEDLNPGFDDIKLSYTDIKATILHKKALGINSNPIDAPIPLVEHKEVEETHIPYASKWHSAKDVGDSVYIENDYAGVLITTKNSLDFEQKIKSCQLIKIDNRDDTYGIIANYRAGVPLSTEIDTNYGEMNLLYVEPLQTYKYTLKPKALVWSEDILFEIIALQPKYLLDVLVVEHIVDLINDMSKYFTTTLIKKEDISVYEQEV